jgi:hypothetical protein
MDDECFMDHRLEGLAHFVSIAADRSPSLQLNRILS